MPPFEQLWERFLSGSLTGEEAIELQRLLRTGDRQVPDAILQLLQDKSIDQLAPMEKEEVLLQRILEAGRNHKPAVIRAFGKPYRWAAAVAAALILLAGIIYYKGPGKKETPAVTSTHELIAHDLAPGHNGAILTLDNGQQVVLDSAGNGVVASQNGTQVLLDNGQLAYNADGAFQVAYNTVTTPRGRQFHVRLPDSSSVWLNANSQLKYPTAFTGGERKVELTGEAYFEVSHRLKKDGRREPFIVQINATTNVEVLGTHFNINAYSDEATINTTLLEGAVRMNASKQGVTIAPGEQARVGSNGVMNVMKGIDTDQTIAWIKGIFDFQRADIRSVMRQLSRWYDMEVVYEGPVPPREFDGKIGRDLRLSQVLKGMKNMGLHFRLEEGRRLIVMP